jgi:hypothetical protein
MLQKEKLVRSHGAIPRVPQINENKTFCSVRQTDSKTINRKEI